MAKGAGKISKVQPAAEQQKADGPPSGERPAGMQIYWDLASLDDGVRQVAASCLVEELVLAQKNYSPKEENEDSLSPPVQYAVRRLVRGLGSSRQGARQGFATALSEVLHALPVIRAKRVVDVVKENLELTGDMTGQDTRDTLLGRLFAYAALARSGALMGHRPGSPSSVKDNEEEPVMLAVAQEVVAEVVELAAKKSFLGEVASQVLLQILSELPPKALEHVTEAVPTLQTRWLAPVSQPKPGAAPSSQPPTVSPDALFLALEMWRTGRMSPALLAACPMLPPSGDAREMFRGKRLAALVEPLKASTSSHPAIHSVWPPLLSLLLPWAAEAFTGVPASAVKGGGQGQAAAGSESADTAAKKKRKGGEKKGGDADHPGATTDGHPPCGDPELAAFWRAVVDEGLFTSSLERKFLGFKLLSLAFPHLRPSQVPLVLTPQLLRSLVNQLHDKSNYLHAAAQACLATMLATVGAAPPAAPSLPPPASTPPSLASAPAPASALASASASGSASATRVAMDGTAAPVGAEASTGRLRVALLMALQRVEGGGFDKLSRTHAVATLVRGLSPADCFAYLHFLKEEFVHGGQGADVVDGSGGANDEGDAGGAEPEGGRKQGKKGKGGGDAAKGSDDEDEEDEEDEEEEEDEEGGGGINGRRAWALEQMCVVLKLQLHALSKPLQGVTVATQATQDANAMVTGASASQGDHQGAVERAAGEGAAVVETEAERERRKLAHATVSRLHSEVLIFLAAHALFEMHDHEEAARVARQHHAICRDEGEHEHELAKGGKNGKAGALGKVKNKGEGHKDGASSHAHSHDDEDGHHHHHHHHWDDSSYVAPTVIHGLLLPPAPKLSQATRKACASRLVSVLSSLPLERRWCPPAVGQGAGGMQATSGKTGVGKAKAAAGPAGARAGAGAADGASLGGGSGGMLLEKLTEVLAFCHKALECHAWASLAHPLDEVARSAHATYNGLARAVEAKIAQAATAPDGPHDAKSATETSGELCSFLRLVLQLELHLLLEPASFFEPAHELVTCFRNAFLPLATAPSQRELSKKALAGVDSSKPKRSEKGDGDKKGKKGKQDVEEDEEGEEGDGEGFMDVLVDIFLSLLAKDSAPVRDAVEGAFRAFSHRLTPVALGEILRVIGKRPPQARRGGADDEDDDEDMEDEEDEEGEGSEDEGSDEEEEEDEDDDDEVEEEEQEGDKKGKGGDKKAAAAAAGKSPQEGKKKAKVEESDKSRSKGAGGGNGDDDDDEEEEDDDDDNMDDKAMFRIDKMLAQAFQSMRKGGGAADARARDQQLHHFQFRALSLLEIFLRRRPGTPLAVLTIEPLLRALALSHAASAVAAASSAAAAGHASAGKGAKGGDAGGKVGSAAASASAGLQKALFERILGLLNKFIVHASVFPRPASAAGPLPPPSSGGSGGADNSSGNAVGGSGSRGSDAPGGRAGGTDARTATTMTTGAGRAMTGEALMLASPSSRDDEVYAVDAAGVSSLLRRCLRFASRSQRKELVPVTAGVCLYLLAVLRSCGAPLAAAGASLPPWDPARDAALLNDGDGDDVAAGAAGRSKREKMDVDEGEEDEQDGNEEGGEEEEEKGGLFEGALPASSLVWRPGGGGEDQQEEGEGDEARDAPERQLEAARAAVGALRHVLLLAFTGKHRSSLSARKFFDDAFRRVPELGAALLPELLRLLGGGGGSSSGSSDVSGKAKGKGKDAGGGAAVALVARNEFTRAEAQELATELLRRALKSEKERHKRGLDASHAGTRDPQAQSAALAAVALTPGGKKEKAGKAAAAAGGGGEGSKGEGAPARPVPAWASLLGPVVLASCRVKVAKAARLADALRLGELGLEVLLAFAPGKAHVAARGEGPGKGERAGKRDTAPGGEDADRAAWLAKWVDVDELAEAVRAAGKQHEGPKVRAASDRLLRLMGLPVAEKPADATAESGNKDKKKKKKGKEGDDDGVARQVEVKEDKKKAGKGNEGQGSGKRVGEQDGKPKAKQAKENAGPGGRVVAGSKPGVDGGRKVDNKGGAALPAKRKAEGKA